MAGAHGWRGDEEVLLRRRRQVAKNGSTYTFTGPQGELQIEGKVVESEPPRKLVTTFSAAWDDETKHDKPSMATFEIEPMGDVCKLTVIHSGFDGETATYHQVVGGWPLIVAPMMRPS